MKNLFILLVFAACISNLHAQDSTTEHKDSTEKYLPAIKSGTLFQYIFTGDDGGQLVVDGEVVSIEKGGLTISDTLKFGGKSEVYKIVISKTGMEKGSKLRAPKEIPTATQKHFSLFVLSDDKTDHCFSRKFFKTIMEQKTAIYGGITYNLVPPGKEPPYELDGKKLDVIDLVSANGKKKFKVLNDPQYPFIVSSISYNVNAKLTKIDIP